MKRETRFLDLRFQATEADVMQVGGYAALFNERTLIETFLGSFEEQIAPGAFTKSIAEDDIRALWNHDTNNVIGRNKNGTLELSEDGTGLLFNMKLPNTSAGKDYYELIRSGYVTGVSFGFEVKAEEWKRAEEKGKPDVRTIKEVKLYEVSPVAFPAYEGTSVLARSAADALKEHQEILAFAERKEFLARMETQAARQRLLGKKIFL